MYLKYVPKFESVVKLKGYKPNASANTTMTTFESVVKLKGYKPDESTVN